jgi:hypothetical protein
MIIRLTKTAELRSLFRTGCLRSSQLLQEHEEHYSGLHSEWQSLFLKICSVMSARKELSA